MANNLGFLAQSSSGFFDPNRVPTLGGTIIDQKPKEELRIPNISQAAISSISPDIVESRNLALEAYQKTLLMTAPYGSKAAGINKWYESQKDNFSKEYDDAYAQAMQNQIQSVIDREKPQTEQEFNRLMLQGGLSLQDYETYGKSLWSLNDPGSQSYDVGTLFNAEGGSRDYSTRREEIAARREGYIFDSLSNIPSEKESTAMTRTKDEIALIDAMDLAEKKYGENSEQYARAKQALEIFRKNLVQRSETGQPGAFALSKSDSQDASSQLVDQSFDLGNFSNLLQDVEKFSKATGIRGVAIETIGGVLGQLNPALENGFTQALGGMTTEDAANLRNRLRLAVVSLIPEYTAEESGRISDRERALAENASRLNSITASPKQIRTALLNVLELKFAGRMRNLIALRGKPQYDLVTKNNEERRGNVNALGARLMDYGMSSDEALDMIINLEALQKELMDLASLRND